jgi:hypothetical protein
MPATADIKGIYQSLQIKFPQTETIIKAAVTIV